MHSFEIAQPDPQRFAVLQFYAAFTIAVLLGQVSPNLDDHIETKLVEHHPTLANLLCISSGDQS